MKRFWSLFLCVALSAVWGKETAHREPRVAVVRQVVGDVRTVGRDSSSATEVKVGDLPADGQTFTTAENGLLVVRFHPDFTRIEARANTRFQLAYSRTDSTKARSIVLEHGQLVLGAVKRGPPLKAGDAYSSVSTGDARFSIASNSNGSTVVVLDGLVEVHNNAKDETVTLRRGQKAVSDANGLKISDASEADLQQVGLRQNILEVDFVNPTTEEVSTLEIEYENNF